MPQSFWRGAASSSVNGEVKREGAEPLTGDVMGERYQTAIHEAAHAVIARVLGLACGGATIVPEPGRQGHAVIYSPETTLRAWRRAGKPGTLRSAYLRTYIAILAGEVAEAMLLGQHVEANGDRRNCNVLDRTCPRPLPSKDELLRLTRRLVWQNREHIQAVARALMGLNTLSGQMIDRLYGNAVRSGRIETSTSPLRCRQTAPQTS